MMARKKQGLSDEKRREISSLGGKAAHECGKGHEWTRREARKARLKGMGTHRLGVSRKRQGRYEYLVITDAGEQWISRSRVWWLRNKGRKVQVVFEELEKAS